MLWIYVIVAVAAVALTAYGIGWADGREDMNRELRGKMIRIESEIVQTSKEKSL